MERSPVKPPLVEDAAGRGVAAVAVGPDDIGELVPGAWALLVAAVRVVETGETTEACEVIGCAGPELEALLRFTPANEPVCIWTAKLLLAELTADAGFIDSAGTAGEEGFVAGRSSAPLNPQQPRASARATQVAKIGFFIRSWVERLLHLPRNKLPAPPDLYSRWAAEAAPPS